MIRKPTHPGAVFLKDVIEPLGLSITETAKILDIPRKTLSDFVNEKISLSPELAVRIAKATNTSVESWLQMQYKLTLWSIRQIDAAKVKVGALAVSSITNDDCFNQLNKETIAAMKEAETIAKDPSVKSYSDVEELLKDLKA